MTNRSLIDLAYLALAMTDTMFERTPEEYASGQTILRAMMAEWPFDQVEFDDTAGMEADNGVDAKWSQAIALSLAERLAPAIGKSMSAEARKAKARSYSLLCGAVATVDAAEFADATLAGAGYRRRLTFFPRAD